MHQRASTWAELVGALVASVLWLMPEQSYCITFYADSYAYAFMFAGAGVGSVGGGGNGSAQSRTAASTTAPEASCHKTDRVVVLALVRLCIFTKE